MTPRPNQANLPAPAEPDVGAIAVHEQAGAILTRIGEAEAEWDGLDDLDMVPGGAAGVPFYRTSGKLDGGLIDAEGNVVPEILAVIAARSLSRSYFPKSFDEDPNGRPVCWSVDGVKPADGVPEPQNAACAGCPRSFEAGGKCRKNMEMLAYVPTVEGDAVDVMRFRWGGISYAPARRYWDSFTTRIPKKHPIGYVTRITMEPTKTDKGTFLAAHFDRIRQLARHEVEVFIADARRRKAMWQQMVADDITNADAQSTDATERPEPFSDEGVNVDPETGEVMRPVANAPEPAAGDDELF